MMLWLDGTLQDSKNARIDPSDRGFLLGDGLYETIAVRDGTILRLPAHRARLEKGCAVLRMPPPLSLADALRAVLDANGLREAVLRLTYTRGAASRGVLPPENPSPCLLITAAPMPPEPSPARCVIANVTRRNEHSPLSRIKSLNYLDNILARQEAAANNADDAILLNQAGFVAEATAANLFIVREGRVLTPPVSDGALPGVMRAHILNIAHGEEQSLEPEDLESADEIFLSSSLGLRSVVRLNGQTVGKKNASSLVQQWKASGNRDEDS